MKNEGIGAGWLIAIIVFVFLALIGSCSSRSYKEQERKAWDNQMQKDPSTWTNEEEERYNNFMNWLDDQNDE